ncbi:3-oxoacid CoA-transferase subunit B [Brevibacillus daliensis]|uniref:3-oxoacid CoA-transferase subunit B n=1 Tax=Brevibacillus daliensis TaxID=2892995 RepID=UPI001E59F71B|nr:3-oxoacid CoA-transferase subunit B [Brevibacillus daliensis]
MATVALNTKDRIANRIAKELKDGDLVNLGIGLPTKVGNFLPEGVEVMLQSENGYIGIGPVTEVDPDLVNAGGQPAGMVTGAAMFDSFMSFNLIRGGHVDATVLGALQVDQNGNLANWMVPGKMVPGMGGAMDLVVGAKKVIIGMEHAAKDGSPKILKQCNLPLTGKQVVDMIVTELAVFTCTDKGLVLEEISEDTDLQTVREKTEADYIVSKNLKKF